MAGVEISARNVSRMAARRAFIETSTDDRQAVAGFASLVHSPPTMLMIATVVLAAAAVLPQAPASIPVPVPVPAPAPAPAVAESILDEVRRPGADAVLVNVWATWCTPCREEFPDLLHVARELAPKGLRLVLVSVDFPEDAAETTSFLTSQGVDFATFIRTGKDEAFVNGLEPKWSGVIPATFLYDAGGKLVQFWEGKASYPVIKKRAQRALNAKETP
jgi:thiol-disulfide isomerase/thioredoxin